MKDFYVSITTWQHVSEDKKSTVYVKDGDFFRQQGGLTEEWGKHWTRIEALDTADAMIKAHESVGTKCEQWKINYYRAADKAIAEGRDPQAAADAASLGGTP